MKYRIVAGGTIHQYEGRMYREFEEHPIKGMMVMGNKLASLTEVYNQAQSEIQGQSAWSIKKIEEVPSD